MLPHVHPLRAYRELKGLSVRDFAEMSATSEATVSRAENGKQNLSLKTLCKLAAATGGAVTQGALADWTPVGESPPQIRGRRRRKAAA